MPSMTLYTKLEISIGAEVNQYVFFLVFDLFVVGQCLFAELVTCH